MTMDERIEALTQSVELLASFHRDTETHMRELDEKLSASIEKLIAAMETMAGTNAQIGQLVLIHDRLIKDLQSGKQ